MHYEQVKDLKLHPILQSRVLDAIRTVTICNFGSRLSSTVSSIKVDVGFPLKGAVSFVRDADCRRFELRLNKNKWTCD